MFGVANNYKMKQASLEKSPNSDEVNIFCLFPSWTPTPTPGFLSLASLQKPGDSESQVATEYVTCISGLVQRWYLE